MDPGGFELASPMERDDQCGLRPCQGFNLIESVNHYSYCSNNPVRYVDPTGMDTIAGISIEKDKANLIGQHAIIMKII